jgi:hypothetical protein
MTVSLIYSTVIYIIHHVEKQNLKDFQMDSLVIDKNIDTLTTQLDGSTPLQLKWKYPEGKGIYFPFLDLPLINLSSSYSITDLHVGENYLYAMQEGDFIIIDKTREVAKYHVMAYDLQNRDFLWKRIEKREWVGFNLGVTLSVEDDMVVATLLGSNGSTKCPGIIK